MSCSCRIFDAVKEFKKIVNKFAFNPPIDCQYTIQNIYSLNSLYQYKEYEKVKFYHTNYPSMSLYYPWITESAYILYHQRENEKKQNTIIVLYLHSDNSNEFTLLYSHGNSSSLGTIYPFLFDLITQCKCDIVAYDYSGYGHSSGTPSEDIMISNVVSVYKFMREKLNIKSENIITMGQSIGSFPSVHIAEHKQSSGGIILISPIASGKIFTSDKLSDYNGADLFNNARKIKSVKCPMLIIHGKKDKLIPQKHSIELVHRAKCKIMVWYPSNGNNKNIYEKYRMKFIVKIKKFFSYCRAGINTQSRSGNKIVKQIDSDDDDMEEKKIHIIDSDSEDY